MKYNPVHSSPETILCLGVIIDNSHENQWDPHLQMNCMNIPLEKIQLLLYILMFLKDILAQYRKYSFSVCQWGSFFFNGRIYGHSTWFPVEYYLKYNWPSWCAIFREIKCKCACVHEGSKAQPGKVTRKSNNAPKYLISP